MEPALEGQVSTPQIADKSKEHYRVTASNNLYTALLLDSVFGWQNKFPYFFKKGYHLMRYAYIHFIAEKIGIEILSA